MGKGDKKSKRGKIFRGSFGVLRSRNIKKPEHLQKPPAETMEANNEVKAPVVKKKLKTSASR